MPDHKKNALRRIEGLHDYLSEEGLTDASMLTVAIEAQAEATLYLAEQQRIANLIALGSLTAWESELPGHPVEHLAFAAIGDPDTGELRPEIRAALGIRE